MVHRSGLGLLIDRPHVVVLVVALLLFLPENVIIEQRKASEVTGIGDTKTAPDGIDVINPALDMTPPELISGIITENGIVKPPYEDSIKKLFEAN